MQSCVDSEASTCSTDFMNEEENLKVQLERERLKAAEKDERILQLETRVKVLEMELARAKTEKAKATGETTGLAAKVQQELLDELQKRKAVQYELICTGQQVCDLQEKLNQQEKVIREIAGAAKSPVLLSRCTNPHSPPPTPAATPAKTPRTVRQPSSPEAAPQQKSSETIATREQPLAQAVVPPQVLASGYGSPGCPPAVLASSGVAPSPSGYIATAPTSPALTTRSTQEPGRNAYSAAYTPRCRVASLATLAEAKLTPRVSRVARSELMRMSSFTSGLSPEMSSRTPLFASSRSPEQSSRTSLGKKVRLVLPSSGTVALSPLWMPAGHAATICAPPGNRREHTAL